MSEASQIAVIEQQQECMKKTQGDHETRIRLLEKANFKLAGWCGGFCFVAFTLAEFVFKFMGK